MAQWVKVHAAKQDDVNLIPENHIMKGRTNFFELSSNLCSMSGILKINNMHIILILSLEKKSTYKIVSHRYFRRLCQSMQYLL